MASKTTHRFCGRPYVLISRVATLSHISAFRWLIRGLAAWQIGAVLWFAPHWFSYFNEFAGGPANGHQWLLGSSVEWGQDLLRLKQWQDQHPEVDRLHVAAVSQYDPASLGLTYELPPPFVSGRPSVKNLKGDRGPKAGWYAISVNILKGTAGRVYDSDGGQISVSGHFQYFDNFEPVDMIGYSIYIYHITEEDAARVRAKLLAEEAEWLRKAESGEPKAEGGAG